MFQALGSHTRCAAFDQTAHLDALPNVLECEPADDKSASWVWFEQTFVSKSL
jgi:hypothetical protein